MHKVDNTMWNNRDSNVRRRGAAVSLLLVFVALLAACGAAPGAATQTAETVEVFVGDLSANATASGTLRAARAATLESSATARVSDVPVRAGAQVAAGSPLVVLDATDLELNVRAAQGNLRQAEAQLADLVREPTAAELAAAEAGVESAQAQLDDLLAGPTAAELAQLESSLRSAEAAVASANAEVTNVEGSVSAADLRAAEAQLAAAQLQLRAAEDANEELADQASHATLQAAQQAVAAAQARVDQLREGPDTAAAQGSAAAAAARLQSARAEYERQTAGPTAAQRAQAEAQLADAQASLAQLQAGPTAAQRASAEAAVEQARLALADAEEALAKATITAPFDGAVTTVYVQPGEIAAGPVVTLVDLSSLEAVLQVDEVDVGGLAVGQPATITLESYPDTEIAAEVASIAPAAGASVTGLVTYDVRLRLGESSVPLLAGMTANATLVTAEKRDVLLVANEAIQVDRTSGTYSVRRQVGDTVEEIEIVIGLRDNQFTEVRDGLAAGDVLLVGGEVESPFGPGGDFDGPGGGGPFN
jgi:HlyD family secretion protein